jgi:NDP-sugar pyrophosphorylase family protein
MKIIIPMAGLGTRFSKAADLNPEYKKPKPLILVRGEPMVRWATGSLPFVAHVDKTIAKNHRVFPKDLIFIILREHDAEYKLEKQLREIYSPVVNVIILDHVTRGASETAYQAKSLVDDDEEIIISDSDHHFNGNYIDRIIRNRHPETAGIIPVHFARKDGIPKWSYSLVREGSNVIERVGEKDRTLMELGAHANIGAYYFSKAKHFFQAAKEVIARNELKNEPGKNEFYIAPLYQTLIEKGHRIEAAIMPREQVWNLGTPDDLEYFLTNCNKQNPDAEPTEEID